MDCFSKTNYFFLVFEHLSNFVKRSRVTNWSVIIQQSVLVGVWPLFFKSRQ